MLVASQFFFALVTIIFWALARSTAYIREEENKKDGVANRRVSEAITSIGGFCTGWSAGAAPSQWLKQAPNFTPPSARLTISAGPGHNLYLNLCSPGHSWWTLSPGLAGAALKQWLVETTPVHDHSGSEQGREIVLALSWSILSAFLWAMLKRGAARLTVSAERAKEAYERSKAEGGQQYKR